MTAWTRLGMELIKFLHCPLIFSSRNHTWITASIIFVFVVQSIFCNLALHMDQRFSIGLRSGEFPGQSRRVTPLSLKYFTITLETWQGAESNDWSCYSGVVPGREDQGTVQKCNQLHAKFRLSLEPKEDTFPVFSWFGPGPLDICPCFEEK